MFILRLIILLFIDKKYSYFEKYILLEINFKFLFSIYNISLRRLKNSYSMIYAVNCSIISIYCNMNISFPVISFISKHKTRYTFSKILKFLIYLLRPWVNASVSFTRINLLMWIRLYGQTYRTVQIGESELSLLSVLQNHPAFHTPDRMINGYLFYTHRLKASNITTQATVAETPPERVTLPQV